MSAKMSLMSLTMSGAFERSIVRVNAQSGGQVWLEVNKSGSEQFINFDHVIKPKAFIINFELFTSVHIITPKIFFINFELFTSVYDIKPKLLSSTWDCSKFDFQTIKLLIRSFPAPNWMIHELRLRNCVFLSMKLCFLIKLFE